ncbi:MAG: sugar phosphate nucleotidyltransferase [Bacteroidia bacterium]
MKPTLLILAAGIGSRYGSLKQIDGLGPFGETIIDYSVYDAMRAGFGKVVFVIRKSIEDEFKDSFAGKFAGKIEVDYVLQELDNVPEGITYSSERTRPWGTGHAVMVAKDVIDTPFAMINADDFYGKEAFETIGNYLKKLQPDDPLFSMVGYKLENTLSENGFVSRGVCVTNAESNLVSVTERTKIGWAGNSIVYEDEGKEVSLPGNTIVSMNMFGFTPMIFGHIERYFSEFISANKDNLRAELYIPSVVTRMMEENLITTRVLTSDSAWFGVTYKEDRPVVVNKIRELIDEGVYPEKLWD